MILSFKKSNKEKLDQIGQINAYLETDMPRLYKYVAWACGDASTAQIMIAKTLEKIEQDIHSQVFIKDAKIEFLKTLNEYCAKQKDLSKDSAASRDYNENDTSEDVYQSVLNTIPGKYSYPIVMQVIGDFSISEIAGSLEMSEAEIYSSLASARKIVSALVAQKQAASAVKLNRREQETPAQYLNQLLSGGDSQMQMSV